MAQVSCLVVAWLLTVAVVYGEDSAVCVWESNPDVDQGLDPRSFDAGASYAARHPEISEALKCQEACCQREDCHIALMGTPADGTPECFLVNCTVDGKDVCVLQESHQFKAYRKTQVSATDAPLAATEERAANSTDRCRLERVVGNCRAAFPRYFYKVANQTCELFIYGGCDGNANNFDTQEDCEATCSGVTGAVLPSPPRTDTKRPRMVLPENYKAAVAGSPAVPVVPVMTSDEFAERCQAPSETGLCRAALPRFYYNATSASCQSFIYGGCRGNKNNYLTEEMCMANCTVKVIPSPKKISSDKASQNEIGKPSTEICLAPPSSGPCRAAFPMFHYDPSTSTCLPFIYGGCGGNDNRFGSEDECLSRCSGEKGRFDEHGDSNRRERWTPAFFLVATLAVISAVLLVGLILMSVQRARQHKLHCHQPLDDKLELLPEEMLIQDETPPKKNSA